MNETMSPLSNPLRWETTHVDYGNKLNHDHHALFQPMRLGLYTVFWLTHYPRAMAAILHPFSWAYNQPVIYSEPLGQNLRSVIESK